MSDVQKRRAVFEFYRDRADIICLQETHSTEEKIKQWKLEWGGVALFSHGTNTSKGVCILIRKSFYINILKSTIDQQGRYIICEMETQEENRFTLACIYGPTSDSSAYYDSIAQNLADFSADKILVGDFNVALNPNKDRFNSLFNNKKSHSSLMQLMDEYLLVDVWRVRNDKETYFSWKRHANKQASRIDFALISQGFVNKCDNVTYLTGIESDHSAVFVSIKDIRSDRGPGYWKLNIKLLSIDEVIHKVKSNILHVKSCCNNLAPDKAWEKIKKNATNILKDCGRSIADEKKIQIGQLSEIIDWYENQFPLTEKDNTIYENSKNDLHDLLMERANAVIFRSKARWAEHGEKCSKYFFNLERTRYNAKCTSSLINNEGQEIDNLGEIIKEQELFYTNLYKSDYSVNFTIRNNTNRVLSDEDSRNLSDNISIEELKSAVFDMKKQRAPGPDGLPVEFYQAFWNEIKEPLFQCYTYCFEKGSLHSTAREGILNLIPKGTKDSRFLKNLRPITLLNADYKIVEKVIAKRIQSVIDKIIHPDQTGFMSNRRISLNIRRVLDIMNWCQINSIPAFILNLDFLKAFDRCEVNSILKSLAYFKFPDYIIKWIEVLYTLFSVKIQNRGFFSNPINVERSVHQGGCASAFLFNILVETLANELRENLEHSIYIQEHKHDINQYADDTGYFFYLHTGRPKSDSK